MGRKVTIQDIADALGISRNTVSRAFNNSETVSDSTKSKIFQKASEMGYKQFLFPTLSEDFTTEITTEPTQANEIALFTHSFPGASHFGTKLLDSFQQKIGEFGYKLSVYLIRDNEIEQLTLPANFHQKHTAGILCMELFSDTYSNFLCQQGIPLLFIDTILNRGDFNLQSDVLYMENKTSVYCMLKSLIDAGYKNISFVGDRFNCHSFYERWNAYCAVLSDNGLPINYDCCILEPDSMPYGDSNWVSQQISNMPSLPDVFFAANDYLAISTLKALKQLGYSVPNDVLLCGFDDAPEAMIVEPALTTVKIPSTTMGFIAAEQLLTRIAHPDMAYRTTYVKTDVIHRESTKRRTHI